MYIISKANFTTASTWWWVFFFFYASVLFVHMTQSKSCGQNDLLMCILVFTEHSYVKEIGNGCKCQNYVFINRGLHLRFSPQELILPFSSRPIFQIENQTVSFPWRRKKEQKKKQLLPLQPYFLPDFTHLLKIHQEFLCDWSWHAKIVLLNGE